MIPRTSLFLPLLFAATTLSSALAYEPKTVRTLGKHTLQQIEDGIMAQRHAGHPRYHPTYVFVVDPATQRMHVLDRQRQTIALTLRCGTGREGLGLEDGQTPTGFFTMGGVRIARNADTSLQTGDTKKGVSGVYAELLFPPSDPDPKLRGRVPNGVVIHSYNPRASEMLRQRRAQRLIGKTPCTTGCPVLDIDEVKKLVPFLRVSAGPFDPDARPNAALRSLIASGKVKQHQGKGLGAGIFVMGKSQNP
jgi:hypothetical protein